MDEKRIFCAGKTKAARYSFTYLKDLGMNVTDSACEDAGYLLLDVPSFEQSGFLRMGGDLAQLLRTLPENMTVCGGNLADRIPAGYRTVDFLQDPIYLAQNAWLTAECALDVALPCLTVALRDLPILILGWGRIGKCLSQLLRDLHGDVSVAVRNPTDLAMLQGLGYRGIPVSKVSGHLHNFRLIFNTIPAPVLNKAQMSLCRKDCVRIELASTNGMDDPDAIIARGLPGIHLPESSGHLIAETFLRYYREASL